MGIHYMPHMQYAFATTLTLMQLPGIFMLCFQAFQRYSVPFVDRPYFLCKKKTYHSQKPGFDKRKAKYLQIQARHTEIYGHCQSLVSFGRSGNVCAEDPHLHNGPQGTPALEHSQYPFVQ